MNASPQREMQFKASCNLKGVKNLKMIFDVPTRWTSAYQMLDCAINFQSAINAFIESADFLSHLKLTSMK